MAIGDALKKVYDNMTKEGWVSGSSFPFGSYVHFGNTEGDSSIRVTYPKNAGELIITHDMVKYAALIALGPIGLKENSNGPATILYGAKYRFELNDGRTGVLTCSTRRAELVEHILF